MSEVFDIAASADTAAIASFLGGAVGGAAASLVLAGKKEKVVRARAPPPARLRGVEPPPARRMCVPHTHTPVRPRPPLPFRRGRA